MTKGQTKARRWEVVTAASSPGKKGQTPALPHTSVYLLMSLQLRPSFIPQGCFSNPMESFSGFRSTFLASFCSTQSNVPRTYLGLHGPHTRDQPGSLQPGALACWCLCLSAFLLSRVTCSPAPTSSSEGGSNRTTKQGGGNYRCKLFSCQ